MKKLTAVVSIAFSVLLAVACEPSGTIAGSFINDGTTQRTIQYNVQGTNGTFTELNGSTVSSIVSSLEGRNPRPFAVSFNEICWTQWLQIWNQYFGVNGYVAEAQWAARSPAFDSQGPSMVGQYYNLDRKYSRLGSNCSAFGNVVVVLGSSAQRHPRFFANQSPGNLNGDNNEYKGWVCLQTNVYNAVGCSMHATANKDLAPLHSWEYSVGVNQWTNAGVGMFVMGDFNLRFNEDGLFAHWWYPVFYEADQKSGRAPVNKMQTTDGGSPIDYNFRRNPNSNSHPPYIYQTSFSDHHWYEAYL